MSDATPAQPQSQHRFCLCSEPDYCLRGSSAAYRAAAIEYRRSMGAQLPSDAAAAEPATTLTAYAVGYPAPMFTGQPDALGAFLAADAALPGSTREWIVRVAATQ